MEINEWVYLQSQITNLESNKLGCLKLLKAMSYLPVQFTIEPNRDMGELLGGAHIHKTMFSHQIKELIHELLYEKMVSIEEELSELHAKERQGGCKSSSDSCGSQKDGIQGEEPGSGKELLRPSSGENGEDFACGDQEQREEN